MTRFQKEVLGYVACELAMVSESDRAVDAGSEFNDGEDFRSRAAALEKILVIAFSEAFENNNMDITTEVGRMIEYLQD
jgi:hypothetical protein